MNFKIHSSTGLITGYITAYFLYLYNYIDAKASIYCVLASYIGSIVPDFDSDTSKSFNIIMNTISLICSFIFILLFDDSRLFIIGLGVYIFFKCGLSVLIQRITRHRGITHSLCALIACSLAMAIILRYFDIVGEWYISVNFALGYFSHLLLDEINSIYDFKVKKFKIKKSFGTALKVISFNWAGLTCFLIIILELLILGGIYEISINR